MFKKVSNKKSQHIQKFRSPGQPCELSCLEARAGKTNFYFVLRRLIFRPFFITTKLGRRSSTLDYHIRENKRVRVAGGLALGGFVLLLGLTVVPLYNIQETVEATTGTATESSLTLTSVNPTASVSLSVSDPSGTFASSTDAQMAKFSISTTNYTGYTVTIKSTNGNTLSNGINTLTALGEIVTPANFALAANTKYNNKWGILPNYYNSTANTSYISMPASGSLTLDETSVANSTAKEYTIALGVRADYTYAESTYYNTFVIEYVANQVNYSITYNANAGSDTVTSMPTSPQTGYTNATSIAIASATPVRSNYEFKGWCTTSTSDETCSGATYQPGATYGIDQTAANEITLHAMWKSTRIYMQNMASSNCATGSATTVYDNRDEEAYQIQRLADGKCWMLDNLRLNPTATSLTSSNTNITSTVATTFTNRTSGWSGSDAYTQAWYNLSSKTTEQYYGSGKNYVGGYYNYCAASAGTYCMAGGSGSGNASSDLCPAGWRMPTGDSGGEYQILYNKYNNYSTFKEALRASLSGYFWGASADRQGSYGYFWSSTFYYTYSMYSLYLDESRVYPAFNGNDRNRGLSVRCVLK